MSGPVELRGIYQDSPTRNDWENPSPKQVAQSLRKAHHVNRQLVATVNGLYDDKKKLQSEIDDVRKALSVSQLKNTILTSLLSSAVTSAIIGSVIALVKVWK